MGVVDNDIKRVVAFSTKSQLGYKCIAIGKSYYSLA
jgi:NADH:ubiquinone oxidoreductase subunit 5 (subunit L)/multisubunit Na+/H+ antiporter MnhA subunit